MADCFAPAKRQRGSGLSALPRVISTEYLCSYAQKYGDRSNTASPREASAECHSDVSDLNDTSSPKNCNAQDGAEGTLSLSPAGAAPWTLPLKLAHTPAFTPFLHSRSKRGREDSMDSAAVSSLDDLFATPAGRLPLRASLCPDAPSKPRRACPPSSARLRKLMRPLDFSDI